MGYCALRRPDKKKWPSCPIPLFAVLVGYIYCAVLTTPYTIYRSSQHFPQLRRYWKSFLSLGALAALSTWCGTTAYTMTLSSYVEAVKQLEILFAITIGYFFFKEGATIRNIWVGALVMMIGVALLKIGQ